MAKITNEERYQYSNKTRPYRSMVHSLLLLEDKVLKVIKEGDPEAALKRVDLAEEMISLATNYIILSGISRSMLKLRNEEALNNGRKSLYKTVIYLEQVVSPLVDAPFSDYEDKLAEIDTIDASKRYSIIRKTGLALQLLKNAYGHNTKWKWAFVELEGRYAVVAKNIMNLKTAVINTDPLSPDYEPTMYHLNLTKKLLIHTANRYREKYELSTNHTDDFKMGINFLNSLRRFHAILGERANAEAIKKKADIWTAKLEKDIEKQEEAALKRI